MRISALRRHSLALALLPSVIVAHSVPAGAQRAAERDAPNELERRIGRVSTPVRTVELSAGTSDLRPLATLLGRASVVAYGENTHGAHEPLAFRNRLFRHLVEELGFTAIAVETGLPESRRIARFVAGGPGAPPPAEAARVARESFTWGFGNFEENVELLRWMRAYNDDPGHPRKVRFYGMDLSLGGPQGSTPTPAAIEGALAYLARVDPPVAEAIRTRVTPLLRHLPGGPSSTITAPEREALTDVIDSLATQLERGSATYVTRSGEEEYAWAVRNTEVARQGDRVHRVQTSPSPGGGVSPGAWREVTARDSAMAENVRWVMQRERGRGRVLVFAHVMHVKYAPTVGGPWRFDRPPTVMGQFLHRSLGDSMIVIGSAGGGRAATMPGTIDAVLARVGRAPFLLDFRRARSDEHLLDWLNAEHPLGINGDATILLKPATAFDAFVYFEALTPARPNPR